MLKNIYILILLILSSLAFPQNKDFIPLSDTIKPKTDTIDFSVPDSLKLQIDTSRQIQSDIDAVIYYVAQDSAVFDLTADKLLLFNNSEILYKDLKLNSGIIVVHQKEQYLEAFGIPDTLSEDSFTQTPLMYQGSDRYEGTKLTYNFRTQQGNVSMGFSEADVGYYFGEIIKKVTPKVYFIKNGLYTTSEDRIDPEYYFFSPKMKVIPKDKIIAQSVFLYIEGVPVFWIPFAVLPNRQGRISGIITPAYGDDATYGIYFSRFGYFWAINDYLDLTATASAFTKGRIDLNARLRYNMRYYFNGSLDAGYSRIRLGEKKDVEKFSADEWAINLIHSQKIDPTTSINGNLTFVSGKSYYDNSSNQLNVLLRQNVISNLTLSKYWEGSPFSFSLNYYRDQNLQNGDVTERLPLANFNISESFPFRSDITDESKLKLYQYLSYSYSGQFIHNRIKRTVLNFLGNDSTYTDVRLGLQHNINLNFSPQFRYINVRPYFNYTELWYPDYITKTFNPADSTVIVNEIKKFKAVRFFSMGVSLNTKFIGIFNPRLFNITGIKHTIIPSITYNYTPDFSTDKFGYYGKYTDAAGNVIKYSFFEKGLFGNAPQFENQSISFSIGNLFEMKTKVNDTTENKFQLFNLNAGINYNFAADSLKWSELRTDFRTRIANLLDIGGSATFNLYKFDPLTSRRINTFLWNSDGKIADITSFNLNISTSYSLSLSNVYEQKSEKKNNFDTLKKSDTKKNDIKKDAENVILNVPLSGGLNYNYSEYRPTPFIINRSSNISGNIAFSPTAKWKFTFSTGYDIIRKELTAPYVTAYRDLNSWEMLFNWYPLGYYRGFRLEIRIKAPELHDIKVIQQTNVRGAYY